MDVQLNETMRKVEILETHLETQQDTLNDCYKSIETQNKEITRFREQMSEIEQISNVTQNRIKISEKKVEKRQLAIENEIYHLKKSNNNLEVTCKHLMLFE